MMKFLTKKTPAPSSQEGGTTSGEDRPSKRSKAEEQHGSQPMQADGALHAAEQGTEASGSSEREPCSFLSWNANSLPNRCKDADTVKELAALITRLDPDVVAVQEVRLSATAPKGAKKGDGLPRDRGRPRDNDKASSEDWHAVVRVLDRPPFAAYRPLWSLSNTKYGGTVTLVKKCLRKPTRVVYSLDEEADCRTHDENGRVCLLQYPSGLWVLNTYAPNNGWREDGNFVSRREWDAMLAAFVARVRREGRRLVWVGDLNVAHQDADVTHPRFFREQKDKKAPPPAPDDAGQPGFTPNEQRRFSDILSRGGLLDAFRLLHPPPPQPLAPDMVLQPLWSWRGSHHPTDKYHRRAMRIDYTLVSRELQERIADARILGSGAERDGFIGSDHCPVFLRLHPGSTQAGAAAAAGTSGSVATAAVAAGVSSVGGGLNGATAGEEAAAASCDASGRAAEQHQQSRGGLSLLIAHEPERCQFVGRLDAGGDGEGQAAAAEGVPGSKTAAAATAAAAAGGLRDNEEEGDEPYLSYALVSDGGRQVMDIQHTYTPAALRGRGAAEQLCRAAFVHCGRQGLRVRASCTYVRDRFVPRHPEFASLVEGREQG